MRRVVSVTAKKKRRMSERGWGRKLRMGWDGDEGDDGDTGMVMGIRTGTAVNQRDGDAVLEIAIRTTGTAVKGASPMHWVWQILYLGKIGSNYTIAV